MAQRRARPPPPARSPARVARPRDRRAREVERAAARVEDDLDDVRVVEVGARRRCACAAVLITQSLRSASSAAQASISAGSISGSSPCTLTTISSSPRPSSAHASARRSLPVAWRGAVSSAATPCAAQAATISASSAATTTRARLRRARRAARRARSSARRRCRRAACAAGASTPAAPGPGRRTARVESRRRGRRRRRRLAAERARLALEHHRNAVAHRERQPVGMADQLLAIVLRRPPMLQRPLAERADQQVKQASFHADRSGVREAAATPAAPSAKAGSGTKSSARDPDARAAWPRRRELDASFSVTITSAVVAGQGSDAKSA